MVMRFDFQKLIYEILRKLDGYQDFWLHCTSGITGLIGC